MYTYMRDRMKQIKKEKMKNERRKTGQKLAAGASFGATVGLITAMLIFSASSGQGTKKNSPMKHMKKNKAELQDIADEAKYYVRKNVKIIKKEIPKNIKKFENRLKEII